MSAFVNFISVRWDNSLIVQEFLTRVILINGAMRQSCGRNNWPLNRFFIGVTLPWNGKNRAIKTDSEVYQV